MPPPTSHSLPDPDGVYRSKLNLADIGEHRRNIVSTLRLAPGSELEDPEEAKRDETTFAFIEAETGEGITYSQYKRAIKLLAAAFSAGAIPTKDGPPIRLAPGSVVALHVPNSIVAPVVFHGLMLGGFKAALISSSLTRDEVAYQLQKCEAEVVVTAGELWDICYAATVSLEANKKPRMIALKMEDGVPDGTCTVQDLLRFGETRAPGFEWDPHGRPWHQTPAIIPFSSGTSGTPKAVILSHANQSALILQIAKTWESELAWKGEGTGPRHIVTFLPGSHVFFQNYMLGMGLYLRTTIVIMKKFDVVRYLGLVSKYRPPVLFLVPPVVVRLVGMDKSEFKGYDLTSVRFIFSGAAPMRKETEEALVAIFPQKVVVKQGYGMSEMSTMLRCTLDSPFPGGSVGTVSPSTEILVCSPTGTRLGSNQEGEFWVRGPNRAVGYLGDSVATREAIVFLDGDGDERGEDGLDWEGRGWLKTGDVGYFDEMGRGFVTDRIKELIKVNALQVSPSELEGLLLLHPLIADCAVIPVPSDRFGEVPKAFIVPSSSSGEISEKEKEEIVEWLSGRTAPYKRLRGGVEVVGEIPKSSNGKVLRRVLRDREREKRERERETGGKAKL